MAEVEVSTAAVAASIVEALAEADFVAAALVSRAAAIEGADMVVDSAEVSVAMVATVDTATDTDQVFYTFASIATSDTVLAARPAIGSAVKRAIGRAHDLLRHEIWLANKIGTRTFPAEEASLIGSLITRDLPWYDADIQNGDFAAMNSFLDRFGLLNRALTFEDVVF